MGRMEGGLGVGGALILNPGRDGPGGCRVGDRERGSRVVEVRVPVAPAPLLRARRVERVIERPYANRVFSPRRRGPHLVLRRARIGGPGERRAGNRASAAGARRRRSRDVVDVVGAVIVELAPEPFQIELIIGIDAVVEVAAEAVALATVAIVAHAPFLGSCGTTEDAPRRLDVVDGAVVPVRRTAEQESQASILPEAAPVGKATLVRIPSRH